MAGEASKSISKEVLWGGGRSPFSVSYGKMMMWFFLVSDALTFSGLLVAYGMIRHAEAEPWTVGEQAFNALPLIHGTFPLVYVALMTFILIISSVTMVLAVEAGHRNDDRGVKKWLFLTIIGGFFFLGSQAWEWSHFIHGSGGYFETTDGQRVFFNDVPHEAPAINGQSWWVTQPGDNPWWEDAHGNPIMHGDHAIWETGKQPTELMLNKYTPSTPEVKARTLVTGAEAAALLAKKVPNSEVYGANMDVNEYGPQTYANFFFFVTGFHGFHVFSGVLINIIVFLMVMKGVFRRRGHYEMIEKIGLYWHFVDLVWVFVFTFFYLV